MDSVEKNSMDILSYKIEKLKEIFPETFVQGKLDLECLKRVLGENIADKNDKFGLYWNGKNDQVLLNIQSPSKGTFIPSKEESISFDDCNNVFIEGENLEALKLLQKSYFGKIKMIYIDPPYNTGNEFIYPDNYKDSIGEYLAVTNQIDEEGNKTTTDIEKSGRTHAKWLNMMYPRLYIAKNLLSIDGIIYVSIDEREYAELRIICDEIFGEENHITDFIWQNKKGGGNDSKFIAVEHEYVIMYCKNKNEIDEMYAPYKPEYLQRYNQEDAIGKYYWDTFKRKSGKQYYPIVCPDGTALERDELGNPISWLRSEQRFMDDLEKGDTRIIKIDNKWSVQFKQRLPKGKKPRSIYFETSLLKNQGTNGDGSRDLLNIFRKDIFDNPKPVSLIKYLLSFSADDNDIVLDFFAGSGTTAQAVMEMNKEDGQNRRFILVQLPESLKEPITLDDGTVFKTIADITKERIRRVIKGFGSDPQPLNEGLKVFKLSRTNYNEVDYIENEEGQQLDILDKLEGVIEKPIIDGAKDIDIVYENIIKEGFDLNVEVEKTKILRNEFYVIKEGSRVMYICLDRIVFQDTVNELMNQKYKDNLLVCYDSAVTDSDKQNISLFMMMKVI